MVDNELCFDLPIKPEQLFDDIREIFARVDDGHSTPDKALCRIIEHIAINNPGFLAQACFDAGATVPCDCHDFHDCDDYY